MTTLITAEQLDGTRLGRCDANCYNAKTPHCRCICGGVNHGKGLEAALQTTEQHHDNLPKISTNPKLPWGPIRFSHLLDPQRQSNLPLFQQPSETPAPAA